MQAIDRLNNQPFRGRPLAVKEAQPRESRPPGAGPRSFGGPGTGAPRPPYRGRPGRTSAVLWRSASRGRLQLRRARRAPGVARAQFRPRRAAQGEAQADVQSQGPAGPDAGRFARRPTTASTAPSATTKTRTRRRACRASSTILPPALDRTLRTRNSHRISQRRTTSTVRKLVCPLVLAALAVACQKPATTPATSAAPAAAAAKPATPPAKPIPAVLPDVIADCNGDTIPKAEFEGAVRSRRAAQWRPDSDREARRGVPRRARRPGGLSPAEAGGQAAQPDRGRRRSGLAHRRVQAADGHRGQLQGGAAGPADHRGQAARRRARRPAGQPSCSTRK